jgi:hypothetical protein
MREKHGLLDNKFSFETYVKFSNKLSIFINQGAEGFIIISSVNEFNRK